MAHLLVNSVLVFIPFLFLYAFIQTLPFYWNSVTFYSRISSFFAVNRCITLEFAFIGNSVSGVISS